MRPSESCWR